MRTLYFEEGPVLYLNDDIEVLTKPMPEDTWQKGVTVGLLLEKWRTWSEHYHVPYSASPADRRILGRNLLQRHSAAYLEEQMKPFWFVASHPLITGEYTGPPMALFAAYVKGLQRADNPTEEGRVPRPAS